MRRIRRSSKGRAAGFTLVEVTIAAGVLVIGLMGLFATFGSSMQATGVAHERAIALKAAENQLEALKTMSLVDAFAAGRTFPVAGLKAQSDDPDKIVGCIWLPGDDATKLSATDLRRSKVAQPLLLPKPTNPMGPGPDAELREDVLYVPLGLPRDLDASGAINTSDISGSNFVLLPVVVVVEWQGVAGNMRLAVQTTLGPR